MHYGYAKHFDVSKEQPKIINVHRYSQVPIKQFADESYEKYRKNKGVMENALYASLPKSTKNADSNPNYFTPNQVNFVRNPMSKQDIHVALEEKFKKFFEPPKKAENISMIVEEKGATPDKIEGTGRPRSECAGCYNRRAAQIKEENKKKEKKDLVNERIKTDRKLNEEVPFNNEII